MRGPLESALIRVAEQPEDPERWRLLLLLLAAIQDRLDRNRASRERSRPVPRLDPKWFDAAWPTPTPEILVARAIASIGAGSETPLFLNIVGADQDRWGNRSFSKCRPNRAVYHMGDPARVLAGILERRLADTEPLDPLPLASATACSPGIVEAFLCGTIDLGSVFRWLPAAVLIGWRGFKCAPQRLSATSSLYLLQALFRPLFHPGEIVLNGKPLFREPPKATTARRLLHLIRSSDWVQAVDAVRARYLAEGRRTVAPPVEIDADGERVAAALLIPMQTADVAGGIERWLESRSGRAGREESS